MMVYPYRGEDMECAAVARAQMVANSQVQPGVHSGNAPEDSLGIYSTSEEEFSHSEGGGTNNSLSTSRLVGTFYNPDNDVSDSNSLVSSLQDELSNRDWPDPNNAGMGTGGKGNGNNTTEVPWKESEQPLGIPSPRRRLCFWGFVIGLCLLIGIAVSMGVVIGVSHEQNKVQPLPPIAASDSIDDTDNTSTDTGGLNTNSTLDGGSSKDDSLAPLVAGSSPPNESTLAPTFPQTENLTNLTIPANNNAQLINEFVSSLPAYTRQSLEIPTAPQTRALHWLSMDPALTSYGPARLRQRFALKTFYFATNGGNDEEQDDVYEQWMEAEGWHSTTPAAINIHECQWFTTYESGSTEPCDAKGFFIALSLRRNNLQGVLPRELSFLTSLQVLDLELNAIQSRIPTELGTLTKLQRLILRGNDLTGVIPAQLGALSNLTHLELDNNAFTSTIPIEVGQLHQLQALTLDDNYLLGGIPSELGQLTLLNEILLHGNSLMGGLPTEVGMWTELRSLSLRNNQLSDTFPTQIGLLSNLQRLWAYQNNFVGTLPSELGLATSLTLASFSRSQFTGQIPTELGRLTLLTNLWLYENAFSGTIPSELGLLSLLELLPVRDNAISGSVPSQLCAISSLVVTIDCLEVACNCSCSCSRDDDVTDDLWVRD
jgi:Leucine-rich repeat (LRR) protein